MFENPKDVMRIIKENMIDYDTAIILGGGDLGLERFTLDYDRVEVAYEWSDEHVKGMREAGLNAVKQDITKLKTIEADLVTLYDVLEHLTKKQALGLLKCIKAKQIMMFIPIQPEYRKGHRDLIKEQEEKKGNNEQLTHHLSLWTPEELEGLGFTVLYKEGYHKKHNGWGAAICWKNNK